MLTGAQEEGSENWVGPGVRRMGSQLLVEVMAGRGGRALT